MKQMKWSEVQRSLAAIRINDVEWPVSVEISGHDYNFVRFLESPVSAALFGKDPRTGILYCALVPGMQVRDLHIHVKEVLGNGIRMQDACGNHWVSEPVLARNTLILIGTARCSENGIVFTTEWVDGNRCKRSLTLLNGQERENVSPIRRPRKRAKAK